MSKKSKQLRMMVDDAFVQGGHQVVHARQHKRVIPAWTNNDVRIQQIILRSFPKVASDLLQRRRAARWVRIIHLYFRIHYTRAQVAEEMGISPSKVKDTLRSILRVASGTRANAKGRLGGKRGRPKKQK